MAETIGAMTAMEHRPNPVTSLINAIFFCDMAIEKIEKDKR
jgi:hypothetical protein